METKLLVDAMLGSLARNLRIYGFDTIYDSDLLDADLLRIAMCDERVLLTSDHGLFRDMIKSKLKSMLLVEASDEDRLVKAFTTLDIYDVNVRPENSRRPLCNGRVLTSETKSLVHLLPKKIIQSCEEVFRCTNCVKIYWEGGHWRRIRQMNERIGTRLQ